MERRILPLNEYATMPKVERLAMFCQQSFGILGAYYNDFHAEAIQNRKNLTAQDMDWTHIKHPKHQTLLDYTIQNLKISYNDWMNTLYNYSHCRLPNIHAMEDDFWGLMAPKPDKDMAKILKDIYSVNNKFFRNGAHLLEMNLKSLDLLKDPKQRAYAKEKANDHLNDEYYFWRLIDVNINIGYNGQPLNPSHDPRQEAITDTLMETPLLTEELRHRSMAPAFFLPQ